MSFKKKATCSEGEERREGKGGEGRGGEGRGGEGISM